MSHHRIVAALALACIVSRGSVARAPEVRTGVASWYGAWHEGRPMADGCPFRAARMTAASPSLPLGAWVRVRRVDTGAWVVVQIRDRGPYVAGRIIDLSREAAERLGMRQQGLAEVTVDLMTVAPLIGCP